MKNLGLYKDNLDISRKQDIDVVASRVSTNEDNIAVLDSDMETAQGDILTLKTNVTEVTNALTSKQDKIVGGASTITDNNLTANYALVSNGSGKVAVSTITSTELGYLDGVTSNVQTQLDKKLESAPVTSVDGKTGAVELNDIKYTAQALTSEQKSQARVNIGAGTSNFDGDYNSLTNRPTVTKVILKTWTESDMS